VRTSFIKFYNFLLVTSVCIFSNAADYKQQQLDEKTVYKNSEHELNSRSLAKVIIENLSGLPVQRLS